DSDTAATIAVSAHRRLFTVTRYTKACDEASLAGEPGERLVREVVTDLMAAVELPERDVVAAALQLGDDAPAALVDRQDLVVGAVRDEELRLAVLRPVDDEDGREGDEAGEEIDVD